MQIVRMRLYWFLSLFDVSVWCFSVNEERTNMLLIYSLCIHCGWSLNNRGREKPWQLFVYYFFGRNDAKAETPVLWPPHAKSWLIGKDSDAGRDCGKEKKGTTEDEMAGWHHWLDGRESEWTPGVGDGQWRPGVLWFMGSQRAGHDWATELNWLMNMAQGQRG